MTLAEMEKKNNEAINIFDDLFAKSNIFIESCFDEFYITCAKVKREIMLESGEDYDLIIEQASISLLDKIISAVRKIKNGLISMISKIASAFREKFFNKKSQDTLKKTQELASKHPKYKNKKYEIEDPKAIKKAGDEAHGKFSKLKARLLSGSVTPEQAIKESESIREEATAKISGKKVAKITVTVAVGIGLLVGLSKIFSKDDSLQNHVNAGDPGSSESFIRKLFKRHRSNPSDANNAGNAGQRIENDSSRVSGETAKAINSITVKLVNGSKITIDNQEDLEDVRTFVKDKINTYGGTGDEVERGYKKIQKQLSGIRFDKQTKDDYRKIKRMVTNPETGATEEIIEKIKTDDTLNRERVNELKKENKMFVGGVIKDIRTNREAVLAPRAKQRKEAISKHSAKEYSMYKKHDNEELKGVKKQMDDVMYSKNKNITMRDIRDYSLAKNARESLERNIKAYDKAEKNARRRMREFQKDLAPLRGEKHDLRIKINKAKEEISKLKEKQAEWKPSEGRGGINNLKYNEYQEKINSIKDKISGYEERIRIIGINMSNESYDDMLDTDSYLDSLYEEVIMDTISTPEYMLSELEKEVEMRSYE